MPKPDLIKMSPIPLLEQQGYERYNPTAFDEGLTLLQKVNKVIYSLNVLGHLTNEMLDRWNNVFNWIMNEGLEEAVKEKLDEWLLDGTIKDLIDQVLVGDIKQKVENLMKDVALLVTGLEKAVADIKQLRKEFNDLKEFVNNNQPSTASADVSRQKFLFEPFMGMDSSQIYEGSEHAPQGMAYASVNGVEKIFIIQRVEGMSWGTDERQRIAEFNLKEDGSIGNHVSFSPILNLSHQGLSARVEDGQVILYAGLNTGADADAAKGFSKIKWRGASTTTADIQGFRLFGAVNSGHPFAGYSRTTTTVSKDGKYLVVAAWDDTPQNTRWMFVYNRTEVENSTNPQAVKPLNRFKIKPPTVRGGHIVQGLACDNHYIYVFGSTAEPKTNNVVNIFSMTGYHLGWFHTDGAIGLYSDSQLASHPTYGSPYQFEAEGIALRENGNLLCLSTDVWQKNSVYTRRSKVLFELTSETSDRTTPLNKGYVYRESPAPVHLYEGTNDITFNKGNAFVISTYDEKTLEMREIMGHHSQNTLHLRDVRDGSAGDPCTIFVERSEGRNYVGFRGKTNNTTSAGFNAYSLEDVNGTGTSRGHFVLFSNAWDGSGKTWDARLDQNGAWRGSDSEQNLGAPSDPWKNVYASNSSIQTSDWNYKTDIETIPDDVLDAWSDVQFVQYRWKTSINKKGEEQARKHIGLIAQQIDEAFKARGLDATEYGIVGWDEIENPDTQQTEKKWSIRPDECQFLEMALMRREVTRLKG